MGSVGSITSMARGRPGNAVWQRREDPGDEIGAPDRLRQRQVVASSGGVVNARDSARFAPLGQHRGESVAWSPAAAPARLAIARRRPPTGEQSPRCRAWRASRRCDHRRRASASDLVQHLHGVGQVGLEGSRQEEQQTACRARWADPTSPAALIRSTQRRVSVTGPLVPVGLHDAGHVPRRGNVVLDELIQRGLGLSPPARAGR